MKIVYIKIVAYAQSYTFNSAYCSLHVDYFILRGRFLTAHMDCT